MWSMFYCVCRARDPCWLNRASIGVSAAGVALALGNAIKWGGEDQTLGQLILTAEPPRHDSPDGEGMPRTADWICD